MTPDFVEMLCALSDAGVEFLVVGAHARAGVRIQGLDVPVIGRADFVANKRATGRMRDLADVEDVETNGPA